MFFFTLSSDDGNGLVRFVENNYNTYKPPADKLNDLFKCNKIGCAILCVMSCVLLVSMLYLAKIQIITVTYITVKMFGYNKKCVLQ